MRLVYEASGKEVQVGDVVHLDSGAYTVWHFDKPHKPASSGKVFIRPISNENGFSHEYYVGVIGAVWIEREDRGPVTKEFTSFFGNPQQLSRKEYQKKWVDVTNQMFMMFHDADMNDEWITMQKNVEKASGIAWDKQ